MSEPVGYLYRSRADRRYYIFCSKCWIHYGRDYTKRAQQNGVKSGVWAIYPEHLTENYHIVCAMDGRHRLGLGEICLFSTIFLLDAYRHDPELMDSFSEERG